MSGPGALSSSELKLFPNPVKNEFTLLNLEKIKEIEVTDLLGNTVLKEVVNEESKTLNIDSLSSGLYIINYYGNNGSVTSSKLIKE